LFEESHQSFLKTVFKSGKVQMMKSKKRDWCFLYLLLVNFFGFTIRDKCPFAPLKSGYFINSSEEVLAGLKMIG